MTLEERLKIIKRAAWRFALRSGWRYEPDELVNAAWANRKRVRTVSDERALYIIARSAMIDYMRSIEGKIDRRYNIHMHPLDTSYQGHVPSRVHAKSFQMDLDKILKGFTREEKLIIKAKLSGIEGTDIARAIGVSHGRISQHWKVLVPRLKDLLQKGESDDQTRQKL